MIASLFFVSVCVSDCCNFCNCHSDFPDFVDLKIQYFGEIIYNISSKIYIRLCEGIKFCTFSGNLFDD